MRLTAQDLREMNLFKYYRLTRKWACKTYGILDADLELLFYLDCEGRFTRKDFMDGVYTFSWDKARWDRLRQDGWIDVWRHRNRTTIKYSVYKTSYRCKQLINPSFGKPVCSYIVLVLVRFQKPKKHLN